MTAQKSLPSQAWMTAPDTKAVMAALIPEGQDVRFVGGCVRDALLGLPVQDLDIATPDEPHKVMALLAAAGIKALPTGLDHGTVTAVINRTPFEITTLRRDVETDGRWARVAFTREWAADAARRDLTINALSCRPDGQLFDYFDGVSDLRAGRVRFVGVAADRIAEDYLRVLRFFRFHARFAKGPVDQEALDAAKAAAPALCRLSAERVRSELLRLLACENPVPTVTVMQQEGVLQDLLPEARNLVALTRLLTLAPQASAWMRLAAWLTGGGKTAKDLVARLRLSREEAKTLMIYMEPPLTVAIGKSRAVWEQDLKRLLYRQGLEQGLALLLLQLSRQENPTTEEDIQTLWQQAWKFSHAWHIPVFPLAGADLLAQGVAPGPEMGDLLRELENWWMAQDYQPDQSACLARLAHLRK